MKFDYRTGDSIKGFFVNEKIEQSVIKCADGKNRMLVQYSENYNDPAPGKWSGQVNVMHMWIESN